MTQTRNSTVCWPSFFHHCPRDPPGHWLLQALSSTWHSTTGAPYTVPNFSHCRGKLAHALFKEQVSAPSYIVGLWSSASSTESLGGAEGGLGVRHGRRGQENDGSCMVRLRNYADAKWLVEQAAMGWTGRGSNGEVLEGFLTKMSHRTDPGSVKGGWWDRIVP